MEVRQSEASDSLYLHSVKALKRGIRLGDKNLLLIGSGDWNDGLTNVGVKGKGQTVWGSMFAVMVMEKFLILTSFFQDSETEAFCREHIALLRSGIEDNAWDGEWYLRGYFDSGKPFGAKGNTECEIDLLPQAFASVVGGFDPYRRRRALDRAEERLVDPENGIIKLLDPPYEKVRAISRAISPVSGKTEDNIRMVLYGMSGDFFVTDSMIKPIGCCL